MEALIVWGFTAFTTYRISRMVAMEEGLFGLFDKFRDGIERVFGQDSSITRGVSCPYCISFWVSLLITVALNGDWLKWGATAGLACYLLATER